MIAALGARGRRLALTAALVAASPACGEATVARPAPGPPVSLAATGPAAQAHATAAQASPAEPQAHTTAAQARPAEPQAHTTAAQTGPAEAQAHASAAQVSPAEAQASPAEEQAHAIATQAFPTACTSDAGCGYDPATERCGADPRLNRQPPVTDQGIVCYCDAGACALLRVLPVPCEGDHDCAVAHEPRPHPVRATRERPHEKGRPCRDFTMSTTCERTNICTLRRHACPAR
ncbi:hypothetical protein [Sorangium sp. So ce1024]|uniref:hypothetical protein n=1 Tax=unclassified Sorangium TaxID=2621164 RepID=UPI003F0BD6DC